VRFGQKRDFVAEADDIRRIQGVLGKGFGGGIGLD
jgi:hypothetical protein